MSTASARQVPGVSASAIAPLGNVLVLSALAVAGLVVFVFVGLDGWHYYTAPAAVRGYTAAHKVLRPAGRVGHLFGVAGFLMMLVPVAYALRKKARRLQRFGSMRTWLEVHVFCGLVGPVLVTFHTSFKFNGIVSVAYWSMMAVVASGLVGRYLYVRIPRSLRGLELTNDDLLRRAETLAQSLSAALVPERVLQAIERFETRVVPASARVSYLSLFIGDLHLRREIARFRSEVAGDLRTSDLHEDVIELATEHAVLRRRMAYLRKTKQLFDLWHVFHMPLVYVMFAIVVLHVALTLYMGYVPFMD